MKNWQICNFQIKFGQSVTLPPPTPGNEKLADLELSNQVGLQISNCHFNSPIPCKWKVSRFGTFKSSWTSDFKVSFYPTATPSKMKSWQIWNFQVKLDFRFQSFILPYCHPLKNENLADLELLSEVGLQISKCHFIPPPNEKLHFQWDLQRDISPPWGDPKVYHTCHLVLHWCDLDVLAFPISQSYCEFCFQMGQQFDSQKVKRPIKGTLDKAKIA